MATTKIWPTKGHLASVLKYIVNEQKSDAKTYVSGLNCFPDTAAAEMNAVKKHFGKTGGRVAYHAYQSFAPGEVTPDQAHQIGMQLANELWGERFQVVIATHLDRGHLHNHFVLNSVSFGDGRRFHSDFCTGCGMHQTGYAGNTAYPSSSIPSREPPAIMERLPQRSAAHPHGAASFNQILTTPLLFPKRSSNFFVP